MSDKFRAGDAVEWNSHGGIAKGKVKKKLTSRTTIKGHQVAASPDNPEFLVYRGRSPKGRPKGDCLCGLEFRKPEAGYG